MDTPGPGAVSVEKVPGARNADGGSRCCLGECQGLSLEKETSSEQLKDGKVLDTRAGSMSQGTQGSSGPGRPAGWGGLRQNQRVRQKGLVRPQAKVRGSGSAGGGRSHGRTSSW